MKTAPRYSNEEYSVAGVVVHTRPENRDIVAERLVLLRGVEVHAVNEEGKLVVTVEEEPGERFIIDRISEINNTEGVINSSLVFSQSAQLDSSDDIDSSDTGESAIKKDFTVSKVATNLDSEEQK
ncbi:chaperone NapD [Alkalimarinus sediminis]|uniref:Chaperone NapD n=1 Tax=Alkalimarinus sediminis TaxID=1632866 RepID=A0A9E8HS14_9ALTE|nr:chaperone NapD [Alkalimarinus sediminis]UZW74729.1 chaperone NapD [Alkalimarinus sediminis]